MSMWKSVALKFPNFKRSCLLTAVKKYPDRKYSSGHQEISHQEMVRAKIGNREIVGFGINGQPDYLDAETYPFPAIRFCEFGPDLMALREKEKGDWRTLSIDEKKCLYRASFCSTFAEMNAPSPEFKSSFGWALIWFSAGLWLYIFSQLYIRKDAPISCSPESRIAQYYRAVDLNKYFLGKLYPPPGAVERVHPKNQKMLDELKEKLKAQK